VDHTQAIQVVAAEGRRIVQLGRTADHSARVPHMARWRLHDVIAHLGGVHLWAADIVRTGTIDGKGFRKGRATGQELVGWYQAALTDLVVALTQADPADVCPNFSPGSASTVGFWSRRQCHETTIHRYDVQAAAGEITPTDATVATDGIDEFLFVFARTRGGWTVASPVALTASDTGASWTVRPAAKPGRIDVARGVADDVRSAAVTGTAEHLVLSLWGRPSSGTIIDPDGRSAELFG
jgi:uncharacterized protein (TIGR03083 family)